MEMKKMKCKKCKEEIIRWTTILNNNYWGMCDCTDYNKVLIKNV